MSTYRDPAFGNESSPFSGIPSFMRVPVTRDLKDVDVAVVGIPYDSGTSHRSGTRFGPRKIREASLSLWGYNNILEIAPLDALNVADYGDVAVIPVSIEATMAAITSEVSAVLDQGPLVIALGGDHSISLPLLRAHAQKYGPISVVHFDSHPDTWEEDIEGQPYGHATPFQRAIEEELIDTSAYIQVGIRGPTGEAGDLQHARDVGARVLTADEAMDLGMPAIVEAIHSTARGPVYVTLDIDSIDPAYAPGTGTPEVGGFTSHQMLRLVRGLRGLNLIGFDLVEVSPPYDHGDITAILAANLAFEFLSLLAVAQRE